MNGLDLSRRLEERSRAKSTPLPQITDWPRTLDASEWCLSPELCSLYGTPALDMLPEPQQRRLAFFELINFFSLNIHGERWLLAGLARHLYGATFEPDDRYVHHFIDEENKHLHYFATFCRTYAGKIYPERSLAWPREYEPGEEAFLFFAKVMLFEDVVDDLNRRMALDERLWPLIRDINRLHHEDEVRHLAYGRMVTQRLYRRWAPYWSQATRDGVGQHLSEYVWRNLREYCNPEVYLDAGLVEGPTSLDDAHALADLAFENSRARHWQRARRAVSWLREMGALASDSDAPAAEE